MPPYRAKRDILVQASGESYSAGAIINHTVNWPPGLAESLEAEGTIEGLGEKPAPKRRKKSESAE